MPLIAFNALYRLERRRGPDVGQPISSAATPMATSSAPFRLDLGPREFRGLAARPLPDGAAGSRARC